MLSKGKATEFVSTARMTHATPAALYAHSPHRDWECDSDIPQKETDIGCIDIAQQLITLGQDTQVQSATLTQTSVCVHYSECIV